MGKTLIKVNCVDQQLFVSTPPLVASGGINEDEVEFSFGPLWDGFTKTAVFYRDGGVVYHVLLSDDKATIPQEVLKDEGTLYFGVFGVKDGVRRTSEVLRYKIKAGAITTGTTPPDPTPDIYAQITSALAGCVRFDSAQDLTEAQKEQARANIGAGTGSGSSGTTDHSQLTNRDAAEQHPISAITGLQAALDGKQATEEGKGLSTNDYTNAEKAQLANIAAFTVAPSAYEVSSNPIQIDNYEGMPMDVIATFAPKQDGSGDPSPTNIRAISGWTGAKLTKCGKNLCPGFESGGYDNNTGTTFDSANYYRTKKIPITEGATYTHSTNKGWNPNDIHFWDKNEAHLGHYASISALNDRPAGAAYVAFNYYEQEITWVQLELGSTATAYEPYQGKTFSATFGQTVYGGTLNWNTGVLAVDRTIKVLDGSNVKAYSASAASGKGNAFIVTASDALMPATASTLSSAMCSHYPTVLGGDAYNGVQGICVRATGAELYIYDSSRSSMTDTEYNSWLAAQSAAGTPVQVCYKLSTPTTIQLTAHEIAALRGVNTLYGDGTLTVSGRKDILWLTEKLTERVKTLESAIVAMGGNV